MTQHIAYPSIEQFRNIVKRVKDCSNYHNISPLPTILFRGTVKLHGTNASIVYDSLENVFYAQSRSNVLSLESDNAGFCQYFETNREFFENWLRNLRSSRRYVVVYGEWCGGNIQKGVAINGLPKMFVVFETRLCDIIETEEDGKNTVSEWIRYTFKVPKNDINLYNIRDFGQWEVSIDFNSPENSQNFLVQITEKVEAECPVGKFFGNSGVGEGVVWTSYGVKVDNIDAEYYTSIYEWAYDLVFKVKGEQHSVSKVKTLAAVDVEIINNQKELIDSLATENRFTQGITVLKEQGIDPDDSKNTKAFIEWVRNDIIKEDKDTILASGLDFGKILGGISSKAGQWFNNR